MASSTTRCSSCSVRHITKTSTYWCGDCEEAICDDCQVHHKVPKATRGHELIPIAKYMSLLSFITDIQQSCTHHNEKCQQYCVVHALPICFKCTKEHNKCNVIPLDDVINNAKTSGQLEDLETRLIDLLQNIDRIKKDRNDNLASIAERKEELLADIHQIRNQINNLSDKHQSTSSYIYLDKLEKEIIQDLEKKECQCKESIQSIISFVEERTHLITEYQINLQSTKQHGSDQQTFLVMRDIEVKVLKQEQFLQSLIETKQIDKVDLIFKIEPGGRNVLDSLKNFGSIEIKTQSSNIRLIRAKDKQAQFQVTPTNTTNDLKLILQKKIKTGGRNIRGCCMSVNDEYLLSDYHNSSRKTLAINASDGTLKYELTLRDNYGFDITFIDETTVAITYGWSRQDHKIDIVDIKSRKKRNFINLPGRPWGVTLDQDSLFVCVERQGIFKINIIDYTTSHVIKCNLAWFSYVSVFDDKIYYTDCRDNSVVCCDRYGSRVWTFKDELVLKAPSGITVDNGGNVFAVGEDSSNVVIILNNGKHHRQVLTKDDGLWEPSAILFDKKTEKLLVANTNESAFLYNVT